MIKTLQLQKPHIIVVVGIPGSGKTFFAEKFSDMFGAPYQDFSRYRRAIDDQNKAMELANNAFMQLLKTKQTVVVEGVGEQFSERQTFHSIAKKHGYEEFYVWVQTEPNTAKRRATQSKIAPIDEEEFIAQATQFENFKKGEPFVVVSGRHTYASQAKLVLKRLITERPPINPNVHRIVPSRGRIMG